MAALDKNVAIYVVGAVTALLTAFYSFRALFVTFHGKPRDAVLRLRPRNFLSIDLVPVAVGAEFNATADWSLTGRLGVSVLMGPLRVGVDLPRLDYRRLEIDMARGFDLRFSVDLSEVFQWSGTAVSLGAHGGRGAFPAP